MGKTLDKNPLDQATLVDEDDNVVGSMDKYEAHLHPAHRHRAASVWLINSKTKKVLLQQRSKKKIVGAGWWANTICANVRPVENYEECAYRRLREELGIKKVSVKPIYTFAYNAYCNKIYGENEIDRVFVGTYDGKVIPNPEEVSDYLWVDLKKINLIKKAGTSLPLVNETLELSEDKLKEKTKPISHQFRSHEVLVAPWSIWMLRDKRLTMALS